MAKASIEVRVSGKGTVIGEQAAADPNAAATCDLCGSSVESVASIQSGFACADCLRERLEAMSVARWRFKETNTLPWGKLTS